MLISLDLSQRQMGRALEQALRAQVTLEIETRTRPDDSAIRGVFRARRENLLHVDLAEGGIEQPLERLLGAFCDVRLTVSGEQYLFTTCVVEIDDSRCPMRLSLASPQAMQVTNRRRFLRRRFRTPTEVRISAEEFDQPLHTTLLDVGGDGLACRGSRCEVDALLVGDPVLIEFELPGCPETFHLAATVCSKTAGDEKDYLMLGLEFSATPGDSDSRRAIDQLREAIVRDNAETSAKGEEA